MSGKEISRVFKAATRRASRRVLDSGETITVKQGRSIVEKNSEGVVKIVTTQPVAYRKVKRLDYDIGS